MKEIKLGSRIISELSKPYLIAEIGVNHEGSIDTAKKMILEAKEGGADAVKFQSYKAEKLATKNAPAYWDTSKEKIYSQFELFKKYDTFNEKDYIFLAKYCKKNKIDFISTPFDTDAVDYLNPFVPFFKISSSDITNFPLLRKVASKNKPVLLSSGASTINEIKIAISELRNFGCNNISILHCILNYPTLDINVNLNMINDLKEKFPDLLIGYSDHTLPDPSMIAMTSAYLSGAVILEKHFTHNKEIPGNDHYHSMDIKDLKTLSLNLNKVFDLRGSSLKKPLPSEKKSRLNARRSIVLKCEVKKNSILKEEMITCKRPASGICPSDWDRVIGKTIKHDLYPDQILSWSDIKD